MAETENISNMESLKSELNSLKSQLEDLLKTANSKGHSISDDLASHIIREWGEYKNKAGAQADRLYHAGQAGMEEVGNHVRQNPLASVLIAFGAGYLLSCLFRNLR